MYHLEVFLNPLSTEKWFNGEIVLKTMSKTVRHIYNIFQTFLKDDLLGKRVDVSLELIFIIFFYFISVFGMYSFVSQWWCAFWQKNDIILKWSIVKSTSEPKQQRKAYHLNDTSLLCDFEILRNPMTCFYE